MATWRNNLTDPDLPPAQSFAVVGPMPVVLRRAYEWQLANATPEPEDEFPEDEELEEEWAG